MDQLVQENISLGRGQIDKNRSPLVLAQLALSAYYLDLKIAGTFKDYALLSLKENPKWDIEEVLGAVLLLLQSAVRPSLLACC